MRALQVNIDGQILLTEKPLPQPPPGWARIRVSVACVCATDLEIIDQTIPARLPLTPGHEWSGVVDHVGSDSDQAWVGRRVTGSNDICCLTCPACRSGQWRLCPSFREIGFMADGAYADYMLVPVYALYELPAGLSMLQGALVEPLGVGLGIVEKANLRLGETMTVIGLGSVGLNTIVIARAAGAGRILATAASDKRLAFALRAGASQATSLPESHIRQLVADLHDGGSDVVVEATGAMSCYLLALDLAGKAGRIVLAGYGRRKQVTFTPDQVHINNLQVIGAGNNWNMVERCLRLLEMGLVDTSFLVTHTFSLADYREAFSLTRERPAGFIKAAFILEQETGS